MTLNYGHRGASGYYPENTMQAFERAIDMGCHGIETDVHLTKDGIAVLCHDEKIDRTTNGSGLIMDFTYKELCRYDAGIKFGDEFKSQKIPTLIELLELVKDKCISVNLELKNNRIEYENLEKLVIKMVYEYNLEDKTIISSFNHYSVMKCKEFDNKIKLGFLYDDPLYKPGKYGKSSGVDALHPNYLTLKDYVIEEIKNEGLMINTYTVNDEEDMKRLVEQDIDIIITNYPDKLTDIIAKCK